MKDRVIMATIQRFEDIEAWKKARILCQYIYTITKRELFVHDFRFRDQLRASGGSVMDNIAEGFERGGTKEFINFLRYAKGSTGEVRSQLYRAFDQEYITEDEFKELYQRADSISKMIKGFMKYLKTTPIRGTNY